MVLVLVAQDRLGLGSLGYGLLLTGMTRGERCNVYAGDDLVS